MVQHEHVVGGDVDEAVQQAALREVDLLAVAGREGQVEVAHEVERVAAHVDAVADRGGQARVQAQRLRQQGRGGVGQVWSCGSPGAGRFRSGTLRIVPWLVSALAVATSASECAALPQPVEPARGDHAVAVEHDDVGGSATAKAVLTLPGKPRFSGWRR